MDASEVIADIISTNDQIARIRVLELRLTPLVQERFSPSPEESRVINAGADLRKRCGLPFWEGVLLSCFNSKQPPLRLLKAAAHHNATNQNQTSHYSEEIERDALTTEYLQKLAGSFTDDRMLAISSLVYLRNGSRCHLPMLDFHCPVSPENQRLAEAVAQGLDIGGGFILESGESFHFYGNRLISETELIKYLGRALLYSPIVDRAWIAHQIIESACTLRISPRMKGGVAPYVVAKITSQ